MKFFNFWKLCSKGEEKLILGNEKQMEITTSQNGYGLIPGLWFKYCSI